MTTTKTSVKIGTTFRSPLADGNPLWIVDRIAAGVAHCHVVNEKWKIPGSDVEIDCDYAGHTDVFKVSAIERTLTWTNNVHRSLSNRENWWAARTVGETLHYHNAFGQFIRGEVVNVKGKHELMPTAMVGKWGANDAFRVTKTGVVEHGYHAKSILNQQSWQPSDTCVYEHPQFTDRRGVDPTTMEPLALHPPTPTAGDRQRFADENRCNAFAAMLTDDRGGPSAVDRLTHIGNAIARYLDDRSL